MKFIHTLSDYLSNNKEYKRLLKTIGQADEAINYKVQNLYGSAKGLLAYKLYDDLRKEGQSVVVVTSTTHEAEGIYQDIKSFSRSDRVFYFPPWEILPYESISPFYDIVHHRIEVLHHLLSDEPLLMVTPIVNLMKVIIPKDVFRDEYLNFAVGKEIDYHKVIQMLIELGYSKEYKVDQPGTFSVKGGILDVFPSSSENPIRIELFDNEIESIRTFDSMTQLSKEKLDAVEILPQRELILNDESILTALDQMEERFKGLKTIDETIEKITNGIYFQGIEHLLPFFYKRNTLLDYIEDHSLFIFNEEDEVRKKSESLFKECQLLFSQSHKAHIVKANPDELFDTYEIIQSRIQKKIVMSHFSQFQKGETVFNMTISSTDSYIGDLNLFKEQINGKLEEGCKVFIFAAYEGQAHRLQAVAKELKPILDFEYIGITKESGGNHEKPLPTNDISIEKLKSGVYIGVSELSAGFSLPEEGIIVVLDREIFGRKRNYYKKLRKVSSSPIESYYDLKKDDLVVHINHGIGRYIGIERIQVAGKEKDFILLFYADEEKLYVPIEQLNLVQKYIGSEGRKAPLDRLGGKSWEKTKAKAKRSVEEVAHELIEIYSARRKLPGYAFPMDTEWQHEFEAGFQYEETPDQLKAIRDIKEDMESPRPTDRLICGDVGYGKTEVSIRAAFKAVMDGKQVAILVPTTILCEQHFRTFTDRFALYPVKIEMLSRIRSSREQKKILEQLKGGEIDIIIGTHRLVSKDVKFKNLALAIIDEEQRFGVKHKEAIKSFRNLVDVISMTATPIPRTLHMSLVKIRDMSVIDTPPENRRPIETYTMEFNDDIIKDAIYRELDRDGQVYFLHNRVQTIKGFARYLNTLVPEARVCVAHGQMEEHDLENIIVEFIGHKYDIIVCTTIIESGIDISNVNTMLIDRADSLGLSQLYQLRGRVGRGDRKAYCYLFYAQDKPLTEIAQKRLAVINEYTDLGSGFKIAMKDMEFRGAGNVLGVEQSGSIVSVGFELYCKLLDDAVVELSTGEKAYDQEIYVDLKYDGYIPDDYVPDEKQKIEVYKKIAGAISEDEIGSIQSELEDRFGSPPSIISNLLKLAEVKVIAKSLKIFSIVERGEEVVIEFNEHSIVRPERILVLAGKYKNALRIHPEESQKLYLKVKADSLKGKVRFLKEILSHLK